MRLETELAPRVAQLSRDGRLKIQIQFNGNGEQAVRVSDWLTVRFPHLDGSTRALPGLSVALTLPRTDSAAQEWAGTLIDATAPLDVALEILGQCFAELALPTAEVLSLHVTER